MPCMCVCVQFDSPDAFIDALYISQASGVTPYTLAALRFKWHCSFATTALVDQPPAGGWWSALQQNNIDWNIDRARRDCVLQKVKKKRFTTLVPGVHDDDLRRFAGHWLEPV